MSENEPGQFDDAIEVAEHENPPMTEAKSLPTRAIVFDGRGDVAYIDDTSVLDLSEWDDDELFSDMEDDELREEDFDDNRVDDEDWDVTERGAPTLTGSASRSVSFIPRLHEAV